jgi:hypothetical protein
MGGHAGLFVQQQRLDTVYLGSFSSAAEGKKKGGE